MLVTDSCFPAEGTGRRRVRQRQYGTGPDRVIAAFTAAGFAVEARHDRWGGRTFLIAFRAP
jgi:hypothetical protein